ncbi:MAG: NimC/NimA family protein [Oscillospiraceae bacterium]|nr:NimC/NimA family protein [Oscillospiraceae bacterium]
MNRAYEYLKGKTYFIATEDGPQARVRPFGSLYQYEDRLYFSTTNNKPVYRQLKTAPLIEISAMGEGGWIRITAEAVEEERREVRERFWRETAERLGRDPGNMSDTMAVFYLKNAAAVINRYGAEPEEFTF